MPTKMNPPPYIADGKMWITLPEHPNSKRLWQSFGSVTEEEREAQLLRPCTRELMCRNTHPMLSNAGPVEVHRRCLRELPNNITFPEDMER